MVLAVIYTAIAVWLAAYGLNALILALLYLNHVRRDRSALVAHPSEVWPVKKPTPSSVGRCSQQAQGKVCRSSIQTANRELSAGARGTRNSTQQTGRNGAANRGEDLWARQNPLFPSREGQGAFRPLPVVTVQIPVFNERHVVEGAIDAVAALEYPPNLLQIQVLDDSTDETARLASRRAARHRRSGVDIEVLRRGNREGFKAGALAWGLDRARGDAIAIFDADFRPRPDFLLRTVPHFLDRPRLGLVQVRWSHLNAEYSPLTRAQAVAFDGHFVVEQTARDRSGLLMNFNGTAGVWRRACIEESGGWKADTLSEDLDLSYRAQLAGWETLYLPEVDAPAELPSQIAAFKRQQARWTQGSIQTLRKLAGRILRSRDLSAFQKAMALLHLSGYLAHALMVLLLLVTLPLLLLNVAPPALGNVGLLLGLGPPLVYLIGQQQLYPDWAKRLRSFPLLILVGVGIAWNNTLAVLRGLTRWGGPFARTPKFWVEGGTGPDARHWLDSAYRLDVDRSVIGEAVLALYALGSTAVAFSLGRYSMIPFLLLYAAAFGTVAGTELTQGALLRRGDCRRIE